jgi:phenylpropionate dioxygenase-like ring-hydroxylating dioxygenase large terminal subunit
VTARDRTAADSPDAPPSFVDARTRRQRVRASGLAPDHWYVVEYERTLIRAPRRTCTFWGTPIALYRDADGVVHAWREDAAGVPRPCPAQVRYGLVWVFPGDPMLASVRAIPALPEREGPDPWAYVPLSFGATRPSCPAA